MEAITAQSVSSRAVFRLTGSTMRESWPGSSPKSSARAKQKPRREKKGGVAGGLATPPKVSHATTGVTSGRKQETGKTGSMHETLRDKD